MESREILISLNENEINILIEALNFLEYEFGFDDTLEDEILREKLILIRENGFNNNFNT